MVRYRDTLWCDGCGIEIRWRPVAQDQRSYCCRNCLNGEMCDCAEILDEYPTTSSRQPGFPTHLINNQPADA
jgi:hypothetical protein